MKNYCKSVLTIVFITVLLVGGETMGASDTVQTFGLWRMDAVNETGAIKDKYNNVRAGILDEDPSHAGLRRNHLVLGQVRSTEDPQQRPELVLRSGDDYALSFDGVKQMSYSSKAWTNTNDFEVEFEIYPKFKDGETASNVFYVVNAWVIRVNYHSNGKVSFSLRLFEGGTMQSGSNSSQLDAEQWYNVKAIAQNGIAKIVVDQAESSPVSYTQIDPAWENLPEVYVGAGQYGGNPFYGYIDNVAVKNLNYEPPAFMQPYEDSLMNRVLLHFDELGTTGPIKTPDDNSTGRTRRDGLILPQNYPPDTYNGPQLVPSFDANPADPNILGPFGNALYFDGTNHAVRLTESTTDDIGLLNSNMRLEMWARLDVPVKQNDGRSFILIHQPERFRINILDRADGYWVLEYRFWNIESLVTPRIVIGNPNVNLADWNHYALEFLDGRIEAFLNGESAGVVEGAGLVGAPIRHAHISGDHNGGSRWKGWVDEVRLSALTGDCGDLGYSPADFNEDCYVDIDDLKILVSEWLTNSL